MPLHSQKYTAGVCPIQGVREEEIVFIDPADAFVVFKLELGGAREDRSCAVGIINAQNGLIDPLGRRLGFDHVAPTWFYCHMHPGQGIAPCSIL